MMTIYKMTPVFKRRYRRGNESEIKERRRDGFYENSVFNLPQVSNILGNSAKDVLMIK